MCRLLLIKSEKEFDIAFNLAIFASIAKKSKEYQGHGWGISYIDDNNNWQHYKNIKPIWEDDMKQFGETRLLVAHARSAFEDKDIAVENNMPFYDDNYVFIFNGELRGVRIKEQGRIGAEKIFNFIKRFDKGDMGSAMIKSIPLIKKKSRSIKALNIIICSKENVFLNTLHNDDHEYFTMHYKQDSDKLQICSVPFEDDWHKIDNNTIKIW
jgi:predicted glutamine amidotransferase